MIPNKLGFDDLDDLALLGDVNAAAKMLRDEMGIKDPETYQRVLEKIAEEENPEVWKRLNKRVYNNTGAYCSVKRARLQLAEIAQEARLAWGALPQSHKTIYAGLCQLIKYDTPTFFVEPEFLKAVVASDYREELDWVDMKLPFPAGLFILPRGALVNGEGQETAFLLWSLVRKGEDHKMPFPGYPRPCYVHNDLIVATSCWSPVANNFCWYYRNFSDDPAWPYGSKVTLTNMPEIVDVDLIGGVGGVSGVVHPFNAPKAKGDDDFIDQLCSVCMKLLLVMSARPESVTKGYRQKLVEKAGAPPKEFWAPNVIGKGYQMKRVKRDAGVAAPQGTHASPRMHWRRGHIRNQAHGVGNLLRKVIWIEPTTVAAA